MSFWKVATSRWKREELEKWTSIKKTAYLLVPIFVYFVINDIAEVCLWILTEFLISNSGERMVSFLDQNASTVRGMISGLAIVIGAAAVFPALKNELEVEKKIDVQKEITSYCFLAAFALCAAVSVNIFFYQTGFTGSSRAYDQVHSAQYGVQFAIGLFLYGVISPLAEEAVFRGLLYNRMKRCFSVKTALVVSSLLFGLYHGNPVQALYGIILGMLIAYTYEIYGNFAAPLVFHAVANVSVYTMTYRSNQILTDRKMGIILGAVTFAMAIVIIIYINRIRSQKK